MIFTKSANRACKECGVNTKWQAQFEKKGFFSNLSSLAVILLSGIVIWIQWDMPSSNTAYAKIVSYYSVSIGSGDFPYWNALFIVSFIGAFVNLISSSELVGNWHCTVCGCK
jgi:hypothetical protein